jgi:hypothetical protein
MYASPADRAAGIERGSQLPARDLKVWLTGRANRLATAGGESAPVLASWL